MPSALQANVGELAEASADEPFDAIVVGAGSAGLTCAATLAEAGLAVVVIEAGPAPFLTHITNTDLRFSRLLGRNLRDQVQYRPELAGGGFFGNNFGCFGGRGLFWNGASPRYSTGDFVGWPSEGIPDDADYRWASEQFRVSPTMGKTALAQKIIAQLAAGAGIQAEPGPFAVDIDNLYAGRLSSGIASGLGLFFRQCGDAALQANVRVATECLVESLIIEGNEVRGVRVSRPDQSPVEIIGRSVLLCGGGIESIKLAAVSGVPDPKARIGKGLQEHLFYHALVNAPQLYDRAIPDSAIIFVPAGDQDAHQWEIHAPGNRLFAINDGTSWLPGATPAYQLMIRSFAATEKRDDNLVEARPGPLGSSRIHFQHSAADEEKKVRIAADAERLCAAISAEPADAPEIGSTLRFRAPGSSYHEAGGLDMGADSTRSVTLPDGRFHTVPNLLCADAAAFPRIGATNPHLTIVAIARRKAKALARRLTS